MNSMDQQYLEEFRLDTFLNGRGYKKLRENMFSELRANYKLKQIEVDILLYLIGAKRTTASEIYRQLNLNKGQVSLAVASLCRRGYLKAEADAGDRRLMHLQLTDEAEPLIREIQAVRKKAQSFLLQDFSPSELEALCMLSMRLCSNFENYIRLSCV